MLLGKPESGKEQEKVGMTVTLSLSKLLVIEQDEIKLIHLFVNFFSNAIPTKAT